MFREQQRQAASGYIALTGLFLALAVVVWWFVVAVQAEDPARIIGGAVAALVLFFLLAGLFIVNPNEARVLQLFGKYVGTTKTPGLRYANPFYTKKKVSVNVTARDDWSDPGHRYGRSALRGGRLRGVRARPERVCGPGHGDQVPV